MAWKLQWRTELTLNRDAASLFRPTIDVDLRQVSRLAYDKNNEFNGLLYTKLHDTKFVAYCQANGSRNGIMHEVLGGGHLDHTLARLRGLIVAAARKRVVA